VKVAFELTTPDGHFVCHSGDGSEIRVEAGKTFVTGDPHVIRELDAQSHAVRRVKQKKDED
jgi:hypothetical protein